MYVYAQNTAAVLGYLRSKDSEDLHTTGSFDFRFFTYRSSRDVSKSPKIDQCYSILKFLHLLKINILRVQHGKENLFRSIVVVGSLLL